MFREMRRCKQALTEQECAEILRTQPRGVLAVHGEDGYPYAFPMNYIFQEGKLYFHCAKTGHKLDAIAADDKVSFCIMDKGFRREGEWALNIRSVVIFGRVRKVEDEAEALRLVREIGLKYYPTPEGAEAEVQKAFARVQLLELTIDHMTGKIVKES